MKKNLSGVMSLSSGAEQMARTGTPACYIRGASLHSEGLAVRSHTNTHTTHLLKNMLCRLYMIVIMSYAGRKAAGCKAAVLVFPH